MEWKVLSWFHQCLQCECIHHPLWAKLLAKVKYLKLNLCWGFKENDWKLWATSTVAWHPWHGSGWGSLYITTQKKTRLEKSRGNKLLPQSGHRLSKRLCLGKPQRTVAQLKAREDLFVFLRVSLSLPYISRDKLLCSPSVSHSPRPRPCKPSEWQQTGFVHKENEERISFVSSCADSAQCWLCVTTLSRIGTHRGDPHVYAKMQWRQWFSMDSRPRRKILVGCLVVPV